jgi:FtsP/CotA-like multicopper oxidase with cupredoxin domain
MRAKLSLAVLCFVAATSAYAATRRYYIAAEDVVWDYAPSHRDLIHAKAIPHPWNEKTGFHKTRFIEYTDSSFTVKKPQPEWLGILGPIIRAEVGDDIYVEFKNRSGRIHGIHPHGLRYDKKSEGGLYVPPGGGAAVRPGFGYTYHWIADAGSGPGPGDVSSVIWWYHPHMDEPLETNAGLMGPIIVTAQGKAKPDGSPKDVDQEFIASFMIFDELQGLDAPGYGTLTWMNRHATDNTGLFHAINGYIYGNLPGLIIKKGARVRWYLMGMGSEMDIHTPHWHGKTVRYGQRNTDVVELLPASMVSADMIADNSGTWLFHCQVSDHIESGMLATYTIYEPQTRACPIKFEGGSFWEGAGKEFSVTVRNTGEKPINRLILAPGMFLSRLDLRSSMTSWTWAKPIAPGQQQTITSKNVLYNTQDLAGWAFYPRMVEYADGSKWQPEQAGECFQVYWRDHNYPELPVLPAFQIEVGED